MTALITPKLTPFQQLLLGYFEQQKRKPQGVCFATATLAAKFNVSVNYVQKTIKALIKLGLIARIWDYSLRTRRRFYLEGSPFDPRLPLGDATVESSSLAPEPAFFNGLQSGQSTDSSPVIADSPLDPPNKDSGESFIQESGGAARETPPPLPMESPPPREDRTPPASPVASGLPEDLRQRAAQIVPDVSPTLTRKLESFLARWGRPWLLAAFDRADRKARSEPIVDLGSYLGRTLEGFVRDGAAPDPRPSPEEIEARQAALDAEWTREIIARFREAYRCNSG